MNHITECNLIYMLSNNIHTIILLHCKANCTNCACSSILCEETERQKLMMYMHVIEIGIMEV